MTLTEAVRALLAERSAYEDLKVEMQSLEDALATGDERILRNAVGAILFYDACPFEDMDDAFKHVSLALDESVKDDPDFWQRVALGHTDVEEGD